MGHYFRVMTSSNGNIFRVTCPLCGEFTGHRWIPLTKASDGVFDNFFDLRLNERLSKQLRRWWFETPSRSLWRHSNGGWTANIQHQNKTIIRMFFTCNPIALSIDLSNTWHANCLNHWSFVKTTKPPEEFLSKRCISVLFCRKRYNFHSLTADYFKYEYLSYKQLSEFTYLSIRCLFFSFRIALKALIIDLCQW